MRLLYLTFAGSVYGLVYNSTYSVPRKGSPTLFETRAPPPQAVIQDPDEPQYWVNLYDLTKTELSKILVGLDPQAETDRKFDWDETCSDPDHRTTILQTYNNVLRLATESSDRLTTLSKAMPDTITTNANKKNRQAIAEKDPAFTQMFRALDTVLLRARDAYNLFGSRADKPKNTVPERSQGKPGGLRFICNPQPKVVQYANGDDICKGNPNDPKAGDAHAVTFGPFDPKDLDFDDPDPKVQADSLFIERKYRFTQATSITFCPLFFDDKQFPPINQREEEVRQTLSKKGSVSLDNKDCKERILLHEYLHVPWMLNLPAVDSKNRPRDDIGFYDAADWASRSIMNSPKGQIPDMYAWYSLYSEFNAMTTCGDVWPKVTGVDNPPKSCPTKYL